MPLPILPYSPLTPIPTAGPPGTVIPLYPQPGPGNGSYRWPNNHPFAPDPWGGHGNNKDNTNPHFVYQFTFTPTDAKTPVLKYGISDVYRNGLDRPENQVPILKAMYGATVKYQTLTRTVSRAHALYIERLYVTKHVSAWGKMPHAQTRPGPF